MSSLIQKMDVLKRVTIETDEEFVIEIKYKGTTRSNLLVTVKDMSYELASGKSQVSLIVTNPKSIDPGVSEITYNNLTDD